MGCRSYVGVLQRDGTVAYIYVHHMGYWDSLGQRLRKHYHTTSQVYALINRGSCSSINKDGVPENFYGEKPKVDWFGEDGHYFYGLLTGDIEQVYLFRNGQWEVATQELIPVPEFVDIVSAESHASSDGRAPWDDYEGKLVNKFGFSSSVDGSEGEDEDEDEQEEDTASADAGEKLCEMTP